MVQRLGAVEIRFVRAGDVPGSITVLRLVRITGPHADVGEQHVVVSGISTEQDDVESTRTVTITEDTANTEAEIAVGGRTMTNIVIDMIDMPDVKITDIKVTVFPDCGDGLSYNYDVYYEIDCDQYISGFGYGSTLDLAFAEVTADAKTTYASVMESLKD